MSKITNTEKKFTWKNSKMKDGLFLAILALILVFASWKIFYKQEKSASVVALSETEQKLALLLQQMDGVGEATVAVCETEEGILGAVVVCQGANDLQVIMDVREAVAVALGTSEKAVKVYLKNSK